MRIAVVDDNVAEREQVQQNLKRYFAESGRTCEIAVFADGASFLKDYHFAFDFIILDIDMPGISGMEAAKQLRKKDPHVTLMFVTNMPQYAIEAYSVEAMDYLLKPISYPDFHLKMQKAERYIARNADMPMAIRTAEGTVQLMISSILYVESRQHYLYYHTKQNTYKSRGKLSDIESAYVPFHFARSSESFLVNLVHLEALEKNDIVIGNERLPISRRYRSNFLTAFTKYMGGLR